MPELSLPPECRLSGSKAFRTVHAEGRRYGGRSLAVKIRRNGTALTRLGMAVRRGKDGAVGRNRVKRRLREAFRIMRPELPAGLDVVCMPTRTTGSVKLAELCQELVRLCRKAAGDPKLAAPAAGGGASG